jgi:CRP-like cAMP-binding protein
MNDDYFRMFGNEADAKEVAAGEVIFRAGDPADCFYVVGKGSVLIHDGAREIETVGKDGIFGELALVDGRPRSATPPPLARRRSSRSTSVASSAA